MSQFLWTQKQDIGTAPRSGSAMAFDSGKGRVVLFGGKPAGSAVNDTWEWDGENWTQVADIGPQPRFDHSLAYDCVRKRVVLFGGTNNGGYFNDTWEWDGTEWTQVEDSGPAARSGAAMCFDSKRKLTVLFGGSTIFAQYGDTWVWDGVSWTQEQETGPDPRTGHRMDYDAKRDRVVLFGGSHAAKTQVQVYHPPQWWFQSGYYTTETVSVAQLMNDTWEYDGTMWTRVADTGPSARYGFGFVCGDGVVTLFGGKDSANALRDTWQWDGTYWTQRQDIGPEPRGDLAAAYDSARSRTVIFGGSSAGAAPSLFGDTWEGFERT